MPDTVQPGTIRTEADGRIFRIVVDNVAKRNAFTPAMMSELSEAFTAFDLNDELWVAVLAFAGEHTTAGLDMPKFFGPNRERRDNPPDDIDPFALRRRTMKPVVAAVQGLCLTIGIEMMLAADIVIAADSARFCQMESRRGSDGRLNSDSSSCSWGPGPNKRGDRRRRRTVGWINCGGGEDGDPVLSPPGWKS